jgi:2,5-diamino-6-(ribosylamino)-4(3H)-pyrimidinone 5'-phosphate reductase
MSADGKIATPNGKQLRISNEKDIERMYQLRNESDAVLVGIGTIEADDPKLTVKEKYVKNPKNPIRIILDSHCRTKEHALAVDSNAKTIIVTNGQCDRKFGSNVEVIQCDLDYEGEIDLSKMLEMLFNRGIKKLMVEGGSTVIWSFFKSGLFDDFFVFVGPIVIGGKYSPSVADGEGIRSEDEVINLEIVGIARVDEGLLIHYKLRS